MKFYIVDVFGTERCSGNQLATFFDFGTLSSEEMQKIASEMNFSETTFITDKELKDDAYQVRVFTPKSEIDFAGHPTLGTAYVAKKYLDKTGSENIKLNFPVGKIPVRFELNDLWMTQKQPDFGKELSKAMLAKVLGLDERDLDPDYPILEVTTGLPFSIVPLKSLSALKKAQINFVEYDNFIKQTWAKGILIFCNEGREKDQDISSRVFVNYLGIPEDPATGSATGCLACYFLKTNYCNSSSIDLTVGQGYEMGRPSQLLLKADKINSEYEIRIGGKVIEIAEGDWKI